MYYIVSVGRQAISITPFSSCFIYPPPPPLLLLLTSSLLLFCICMSPPPLQNSQPRYFCVVCFSCYFFSLSLYSFFFFGGEGGGGAGASFHSHSLFIPFSTSSFVYSSLVSSPLFIFLPTPSPSPPPPLIIHHYTYYTSLFLLWFCYHPQAKTSWDRRLDKERTLDIHVTLNL